MAPLDAEHKQLVRDSILDEDIFVRAVFSGQQRGQALEWRRVVLRPVTIKGKRHLQVSHLDDRQDVTKNYSGSDMATKLGELLDLPFKNFHVQTTRHEIQVQITKKGKVLVHRHPSLAENVPSLEHTWLLLPSAEQTW